ncbi:MAG TPA: hypothetical protein VFS31_00385 [Chitinophagaceae bacterium]|nr:hypothetical protein [Chitinophagaceae bacterium]
MKGILYSYLLQQKSLSIPGLGTIYMDRVPARSDLVNRQLLPPFYSFRFDKYFDAPDKDFFTYLAQEKNMADFEAIRWYNEWAHQISQQLRTEKQVALADLGMLSRNGAGDIQFDAFSPGDGYLVPVSAIKVLREEAYHVIRVGDEERTSSEMSDYLSDSGQTTQRHWWIYPLIIAIVLIIILIWHLSGQFPDGHPFGNQQSF